MLQITAGALTGVFGEGPNLRARQLLELDLVTVLATDAHNLGKRPPILSEGLAVAAQILGDKAADDLVHANPLAFLRSVHSAADVTDLSVASGLAEVRSKDRKQGPERYT